MTVTRYVEADYRHEVDVGLRIKAFLNYPSRMKF